MIPKRVLKFKRIPSNLRQQQSTGTRSKLKIYLVFLMIFEIMNFQFSFSEMKNQNFQLNVILL